jgi:hypothetical protein
MNDKQQSTPARRKRFAIALVVGGVVALLFVWMGFNWLRPNAPAQFDRQAIKNTAKELGVSCDDVLSRSRRFVSGPLDEMIGAGAKGVDWAELGYTKHRAEIEGLRDEIARCSALDNMRVRNKDLKQNRFEGYYRLIELMHVVTAPDGTRPPRAGLQPAGSLEQMQNLKKELSR